MLTKNAKKIILYYIMNSSGEGSRDNPSPTTTEITLTNISGADKRADLTYHSIFSFINSLNHIRTAPTTDSVTFIRVGTGTTRETEDDYKLEEYATGLTCDSVVTAIGSNDSKKIYTAIFSNTTDADIAVVEIGFFTNCYYHSFTDNDNFLLDRIVLDTPITIPAGESKAITYELGF